MIHAICWHSFKLYGVHLSLLVFQLLIYLHYCMLMFQLINVHILGYAAIFVCFML